MAKQKIILFIAIIGVLIGIIILAILFHSPKTENSTEKETGTKEEMQGETNKQSSEEYGFHVSSASGVYPKFISGKFSKRPPEVQKGENLTISIKVEDPDGISTVKLVIVGQEETLKKEINLELVEGDELSGVWQGSLIIPKEWTKISWTNFYTKNKSGKEEDLNLRWQPTTIRLL